MAYLLVVDDDEDFATAARTFLELGGHEVAVELTLEGGEKSLRARRPDLLVLDVMFPGNNSGGFDLARSIRNDPDLKDLPILMLTSINMQFPLGFGKQDIQEGWMPVEDFLEKPVSSEVLQAKVDELVARENQT